jgi:ABC-type bacteriocin/lantibiotic exporter with double-glycine peptidase domain
VAWYWWTLLWVVLVGVAGFFLFRVGLSLYRKARLLFRELGEASDRLGEVSAGLQTLQATLAEQQAGSDSGPAVFASPSRIRQERFVAGRRRAANQRVR